MRVGILLPGFSANQQDWAIPVQLNLVRQMAAHDDVRVLALRYPHRRDHYTMHGAAIYSLGAAQARGLHRLRLWMDALFTLRHLHRERPFDVLHAMWADETGLVAAWAGSWLKLPVVVSIAGGELVGFTDINYGLQRSAFSRWIVGQALTGADRVIVACSYAQQLIEQAGYAVAPANIRRIALGVDTTLFRPALRNSAVPQKLIHVASLVPVKDQTTLLRALARLAPSTTLDMLGSGAQESALRSLATELGLKQRIRFLGAVAHLETAAHYQQAAVNILCSRHEGLGMVTLEAAACGLPTVGTTVGLLPDHPELGISVPIGDAAALANAIQFLLDNPDKRTVWGESARHIVEERFTIQETVRQFRSVYAELLR